MKNAPMRGYTLVELIVAIGLFSLVMTLASSAYFVMISINRQTQSIATGINNLSFALETMTRTIRTGTDYSCGGGDCTGGTSFSVKNSSGTVITYSRVGGAIMQTKSGISIALTDPSVTVTALAFYASGTSKPPGNYIQPRVTMVIAGTVPSGPGKTEPFNVETGATMRGSDL